MRLPLECFQGVLTLLLHNETFSEKEQTAVYCHSGPQEQNCIAHGQGKEILKVKQNKALHSTETVSQCCTGLLETNLVRIIQLCGFLVFFLKEKVKH